MKLSLPFKVWTGALIAHAIATCTALLMTQPAHALSFRVAFDHQIATRCVVLETWEEAQSCVGAATDACYRIGSGWTDGQGISIRNLVLGDCAGIELSFWDKMLSSAYAGQVARGATPLFSLETWRKDRNASCWQNSKPTVKQFLRLSRPHDHIADCSVPETAKLYFSLKLLR